MFGVWLTRDPYAPIACAAWSSDMMKRMFGRSAAATATTLSTQATGGKSRNCTTGGFYFRLRA